MQPEEPPSETLSCPACKASFQSSAILAAHLNDPWQPCSLIDTTDAPYPVPHAFYTRDGAEATGFYHQSSGYIYGRGQTLLEKIKADEHERRRQYNKYYPFADEGEWELAKFLVQHLNQTEINEFLGLKWFSTHPRPTFKSADHLLAWMDGLPSGPTWRCTTLEVEGFTATQPIRLIWRDAREVVEDILANPVFVNNMTFDPYVVMRNGEREYSEFFTGDRAQQIQDNLPEGATIIPIILASDKTPITRHTGGLEMHPIFMTIGNIQSDVRMQATSHAWRCIGYIPIPKFEVHPEFQTLLTSRLFHRCMDIIFASLKETAQHGTEMTDAFGNVRNCFTPLVAYVADLPEQQLIASVSKNASPVTTATISQFGDPFPHPPRSGHHTLQQIQELCAVVDPWDIASFQKKAKAIHLLGVHLPFWRDWRFTDPAYFLNGEILHTCHKFFFDHVVKWCKEVVGNYVLDERYKNQHRRTGVRHFTSGVSHIKQMTGRDHRDMQRTLVPMIAGAGVKTTPLFVRSIRSLIEFIYRAQDPTHSGSSIARMVTALQRFHSTKHAVIEAEAHRGADGVKDNFNIPKLELMQSFSRNIVANGALHQYSADVSERLLITHCKNPFQRTSRRHGTFVEEVAALLNRDENIRRFDLYHILCLSTSPLETVVVQEDMAVAEIDPTLSFISRVAPGKEHVVRGPKPFNNHFANPEGLLGSDAAVAYHVTVIPDCTDLTIPKMQHLYELSHLSEYLHAYISTNSPGNETNSSWRPSAEKVNVWYKFRIQHRSSFRSRYILKSQLVWADPRQDGLRGPYGSNDVVLLSHGGGTYVARVLCTFSFQAQSNLPSCLTTPLLFVDYFTPLARAEDDPTGVEMHRVQRPPFDAMAQYLSRYRGIVPLTSVLRALELIPVYATKLPNMIASSMTCLDAYEQYYVNCFADKESYHVLS